MIFKLRNLCSVITKGTTPSTYGFEFVDSGINFIKSEQLISSRNVDYSNRYYISEEAHKRLARSQLQTNDILISIAGAYLGKLAIVNGIDIPANTNQAVGIIRLNSEQLIPLYLFYLLSTDKMRMLIASYNAQSAQPNINLTQLGDLDICVPNLDEQRHIVNTIGTVDDLIEKKMQIIIKLENLSKLIYLKHKQQRKGMFPLGECCDIRTGKLDANAENKDGEYPFFTCGQEILKINTYAFNCEAIIISGNGEISVRYHKGKFNAYQRTYVLSPTKYFYLFLEECRLSIDDLKNNSQGSVIKFITKGMLESIKIVDDSQSAIVNQRIGEVYKTILVLKNEMNFLKEIKSKLLSKYF